MATVGHLTTEGHAVCLGCTDSVDAYIGRITEPIEDPAPHGIYNDKAKNHQHYDAPCALCGWSIRRSQRIRETV